FYSYQITIPNTRLRIITTSFRSGAPVPFGRPAASRGVTFIATRSSAVGSKRPTRIFKAFSASLTSRMPSPFKSPLGMKVALTVVPLSVSAGVVKVTAAVGLAALVKVAGVPLTVMSLTWNFAAGVIVKSWVAPALTAIAAPLGEMAPLAPALAARVCWAVPLRATGRGGAATPADVPGTLTVAGILTVAVLRATSGGAARRFGVKATFTVQVLGVPAAA